MRCCNVFNPGEENEGRCKKTVRDSMYFCSQECQTMWYRSQDIDKLTH